MNCRNCGNQIPDGSTYCYICGANLQQNGYQQNQGYDQQNQYYQQNQGNYQQGQQYQQRQGNYQNQQQYNQGYDQQGQQYQQGQGNYQNQQQYNQGYDQQGQYYQQNQGNYQQGQYYYQNQQMGYPQNAANGKNKKNIFIIALAAVLVVGAIGAFFAFGGFSLFDGSTEGKLCRAWIVEFKDESYGDSAEFLMELNKDGTLVTTDYRTYGWHIENKNGKDYFVFESYEYDEESEYEIIELTSKSFKMKAIRFSTVITGKAATEEDIIDYFGGMSENIDEKAYITEARSAYVAAQAVISENYGYQKYTKGERGERYYMDYDEIAKSKDIGGYEGTIEEAAFDAETFEIVYLKYRVTEDANGASIQEIDELLESFKSNTVKNALNKIKKSIEENTKKYGNGTVYAIYDFDVDTREGNWEIKGK